MCSSDAYSWTWRGGDKNPTGKHMRYVTETHTLYKTPNDFSTKPNKSNRIHHSRHISQINTHIRR